MRRHLHKNLLWIFTVAVVSIGVFVVAPYASGQQLSIRHYDVSDGLAHSHVSAMHQDVKGYLWIATWEGLSRFDGYRFTNYTQRDGLGDPIVNDITEDKQSHLWVATNGGGVARLSDDAAALSSNAKQKFTSFRIGVSPQSNRVNAFLFDSQNNIWCATDGGLFRAAVDQTGPHNFQLVVPYEGEISMAAFADRRGHLWFGIDNQLIEVVNDQIIKYDANDEVGRHRIRSIIEDRDGRLLVANESDIFESVAADVNARGTWRRVPLTFQSDQGISVLLIDASGTLWIGTWSGLVKYRDGKQSTYSNVQGLSDNTISSLTEDRDGNLWIGTVGGGVCKVESELIVSYTRAEGLPAQDVRKVVEDRNGNTFASVDNGGLVKIVEGRAELIPISKSNPFTNISTRIVADGRGDWWVGTDTGLFRFHDIELRRGEKITTREGLPNASIMGGLYVDPSGKVWVSPEEQGLYCYDPSQTARVSFNQVIPPSTTTLFRGAQLIINDRGGTLWLGGHEWLGRLINGQLVMLEPSDGLPETRPRSFFVDSRGWLWIGQRYKGVSVTRDPSAVTPQFINYLTANGLASDAVWAITEDDRGRMYFGTGKGLDQLDLTTGRIRHFNTNDGLASDIINHLLKDRGGNIWAATTLGLSKFNPRLEHSTNAAAPIYLSKVQIAGEEMTLPETGAHDIPQIQLSASRNNLTIDYVALSFQGENELRYQYKLEGVDRDWSAPTETRSINYARLAPGAYRFMVRAINRDGVLTPAPASFEFRILPPIWQRWWFIALAALVIGLIMYALYRQRLARLLELERVRTRIATDLHDDIGANLSLIAMLSEVSRGELPEADARLKEWLSTIAVTSRDTVDSMSDIVWAVNPKRDHLRDLTRRMRRFAEDIFGARNIEFHFDAPDVDRDMRLGTNLRREVFLIFKESINNIARHSQCTRANVTLRIERGWLVLELSDDGRGLDTPANGQGHGLDSMRQRAQRFGGKFEVGSANAKGTEIKLTVPLDRRK